MAFSTHTAVSRPLVRLLNKEGLARSSAPSCEGWKGISPVDALMWQGQPDVIQ
ncbi:MAG: hypothetical protein GX620_10775 [Chloroflexi bacterium]|nr:hypothetical protein [Chloroflexota bacterium]